ncbi:hypothetical protein CERSUDRAFT_112196 [Gelatoporia subvermispora B]|uniref:Uncharacterized protein n=1 Tax=Ceriporiopsis subvermispora (strain B) TaxID=914234 RepID=M2RMA2_CERS8|nr:hypothetical protein CERSUDRAFT_112196 [Gelatoporia subvermispora B]
MTRDVSQRPPLITPSASPPSSRILHVSRSRLSEGPPLPKRPRLASTPSSLFSFSTFSTPSSATAVDPLNDLYEQRQKSRQHLVDFWAQLEERYNRPLDEDDIIDIGTQSVIKDYGTLRGLDKQVEIGSFQDAPGVQDASDVNSEGGGLLTEPEDDVDEIDAFATPAPVDNLSDELEKAKSVLREQAMNPADAEDLEAFLEAERKRRELYGDEEDFDDVHDITFLPDSLASSRAQQTLHDREDSPSLDDRVLANVDEKFDDEQEDFPVYPVTPKRAKSRRKSVAPIIEDASEDEFAAWTTSESSPAKSAVCSRRKSRPATSPLVSSKIIDLPGTSPPHAASLDNDRGSYEAGGASLDDSPPLNVTRRFRARSKSSHCTVDAGPGSLSPCLPALQLQLHTPPQSTSPVQEVSQREASRHNSSGRRPAETPAQKEVFSFPSPPRPNRRLPRIALDPIPAHTGSQSHAASASIEAFSSPQSDLSSSSKTPRTRGTGSLGGKRRASEIINTQKPRSVDETAQRSPACSTDTSSEESPARSPKKPTRIGKGKGKAGAGHQDVSESPELLPAVSPTPRRSQRLTGKSVPKETTDTFPGDLASPQSTQKRKRKRVVSTSSISEQEDAVASVPGLVHEPRSPSKHNSSARVVPAPPSPRGRRQTSSPSRARHALDEDIGGDQPWYLKHAKVMSPAEPYSYMHEYSRYPPLHNPHQYSQRYPSVTPIQNPDIQRQIAGAVQHLTSLLSAATGMPPGHGFPFPQFPQPPHNPWTQTPSRSRRSSRHTGLYDSDPIESAQSSSPYASSSRHVWPYGSDHYSEGTLPPSSPLPSSSPSSPIPHNLYGRERSKSRGLRVSFHLDDNDRPLPPSPQREVHSDDEIAQGRGDTPSARRRSHNSSIVSAMRTQARSKSVGHDGSRRPSMTHGASPGKGKGRTDAVSDGEDEEDVRFGASSPLRSRHTRVERGRTPGPPSRRERS